jgi:predicted GTPase
LVVEDGPSITHGELGEGVGAYAARKLNCTLADPRPYVVGSLKTVYENYPWIGQVLPALGYSMKQLQDLETSINAVDCDAVVLGTPADLRQRIRISKPTARVRFEGRDAGEPALSQYLDEIFAEIRAKIS